MTELWSGFLEMPLRAQFWTWLSVLLCVGFDAILVGMLLRRWWRD